MTQSPYHRVEFNVHNHEQTTSIKLALKPELTLKDALNEVRNVWSAESKHKANLANVNLLSVKDSQGFWLPQDSAINCVLQLNDKVDVFVVNKRKPEASEGSPSKKAKFDKDSKPNKPAAAKQTPTAKAQEAHGKVAAKAQDKNQPPKVQSHNGEGKKAENGGQKRKHDEIVEKTSEEKSNDKNLKANDGNKQGKANNKGKQAENKKAKQTQSNAVKPATSNKHQDKQDKHNKKKNNQAEQNKQNNQKKPQQKAGEKPKQNKQAAKSQQKPNGNEKKQASPPAQKEKAKADNKTEPKNAQKKQKQKAEPKAEEEKEVTTRELTDGFNLNREGQTSGGHIELSEHQRKAETQDHSVPEPSSANMAIEEESSTHHKHKKHKGEKHRKHSHDLSASAADEQLAEVHSKSKKKHKKKNKEKKDEKKKHRKHSHDISATALVEDAGSRTDTKSQTKKEKKKEKKQKKKEEKARRKSKDLTATHTSEQPLPMDVKYEKQKELKAKTNDYVQANAYTAVAPPVVEAAPRKHKAEKKRKSSLIPIASAVPTEQDARSVQSETEVTEVIEIASSDATPIQTDNEVPDDTDNIISALFPGSRSASEAEAIIPSASGVSDDAEEAIVSSDAETESSPEAEATTTTPATEEPNYQEALDSSSASAMEEEEEEVEATSTPTMEESKFSEALGSDSASAMVEEENEGEATAPPTMEEKEVEATTTPTMEETSFPNILDSGSDFNLEEVESNEVEEGEKVEQAEEVEEAEVVEEAEEAESAKEAEDIYVTISENLPPAEVNDLHVTSMEATSEPNDRESGIPDSLVEDSRELSFEPQTSSTPIMIDSPDIHADNEMEVDTHLEQSFEPSAAEEEAIVDETSLAKKGIQAAPSRVELEEVVNSAVTLPPLGISIPFDQPDVQASKKVQENLESSSSEDSDDDDDDAFGFGIFSKSETDDLDQPDEGYLQTGVKILEKISNGSAKPVNVEAVEAATELRKVCEAESKSRLTRAIKEGGETVKAGKEMQQLKAAQLGDEDDNDHLTSGLLPGFMSKSRAPTLSEIYANSQRYIYKSIHGRSPPPSPSRR